MAAQILDFGARRGNWPAPHVCAACGSTRDACRGYPNDVWYCAPCVPPELRLPNEPGYVTSAAMLAVPPIAAVAVAVAAVAPQVPVDLFSGFAPA